MYTMPPRDKDEKIEWAGSNERERRDSHGG